MMTLRNYWTSFVVRETFFAWIAYFFLLGSVALLYGGFFPLPGDRMGHDFSLGLPGMLDGYFWFRNNGMATPWFTPSFCAGQPYFADPQSGYYSLVQWLAFVVNPVEASYLLLLISASLAYWGGYLLLRHIFLASHTSAILAGGLLMLNAFVPSRIAIGHLGYHAFALAPWVALLLMLPLRRKLDSGAAVLGAALLLAYWVHGGLGTLMIPAGIAVFLLALIHGLRGGELRTFFLRSGLAASIALCISAAKLSAGMSLMANFPRDFYLLSGMRSLPDTILMVFSSLFLPGEVTYALVTPRIVNSQWALQPHEWGFGFTPVVAILILVLQGAWFSRHEFAPPKGIRAWILIGLIGACLLLPLALNTYHPAWNAYLKTLPVLGSASTLTRWMILYIPFVAVVAALMLNRLGWSSRASWLTTLATLEAMVFVTAIEPRGFYMSQNYDVRPVVLADKAVRSGRLEPKIRELGTQVDLHTKDFEKALVSNDVFIAGISQVFCYNPVFGYRLEKFSAAGLVEGDVLQAHDGYLNLKNPACYVFPKENNCSPGDRFRADQIEEAKKFVTYRPYRFEISGQQRSAGLVSSISISLALLFMIIWFGLKLYPPIKRIIAMREVAADHR